MGRSRSESRHGKRHHKKHHHHKKSHTTKPAHQKQWERCDGRHGDEASRAKRCCGGRGKKWECADDGKKWQCNGHGKKWDVTPHRRLLWQADEHWGQRGGDADECGSHKEEHQVACSRCDNKPVHRPCGKCGLKPHPLPCHKLHPHPCRKPCPRPETPCKKPEPPCKKPEPPCKKPEPPCHKPKPCPKPCPEPQRCHKWGEEKKCEEKKCEVKKCEVKKCEVKKCEVKKCEEKKCEEKKCEDKWEDKVEEEKEWKRRECDKYDRKHRHKCCKEWAHKGKCGDWKKDSHCGKWDHKHESKCCRKWKHSGKCGKWALEKRDHEKEQEHEWKPHCNKGPKRCKPCRLQHKPAAAAADDGGEHRWRCDCKWCPSGEEPRCDAKKPGCEAKKPACEVKKPACELKKPCDGKLKCGKAPGCHLTDCVAEEVLCQWKRAFKTSFLMPGIGLPSENKQGWALLSHRVRLPNMVLNGVECKSPLCNNALYSFECSQGHVVNLYEIMLPDLPGKAPCKSTVQIYVDELSRQGLDVAGVHFHWTGSDVPMLAIHHQAFDMSAAEFSQRTICALKKALKAIRERVLPGH